MSLKKNETYEIEITDMTQDGQGIGHVETESGRATVFVKNAVVGDKCTVLIMKVTKRIAYGKVAALLAPSPFRVSSRCDIANRCGGCTMQHISYKKQLELKESNVRECLRRVGGIQNVDHIMEPIIGMEDPWRYRNKSQFPVGLSKDGDVVAGFYAQRTHSIIPTDTCAITTPVADQVLAIVKEHMEGHNISPYEEATGRGLVRHVLTRVGFTTGEIMVCIVVNGRKMPASDSLVARLREITGMTSICINVNTKNTNKILGDECITLWGQDHITDYLGDVKFQISPLSFYQVNPVQAKVLYDKALEYADLSGKEIVWDMYCGVGTISLFLARKARKVFGVEIIPAAIENAKLNAKINEIDNAEFFVGKAEVVVPEMYRQGGDAAHADVVVVDPPRKGCDETLLQTLVSMGPKRIVYVSCDPGTLARDVKFLSAHGYELKRAVAVDQFCHTSHCEAVAVLSKS